MSSKLFAAFLLLVVAASFSLAHAEVLVAADESNMVAVYSVPLSPIEGEQVSWTLSFVQNFTLTKNALRANYSVVEVSSGTLAQEKKFVEVKGGVSSFSHTFNKPGIFELVVEYAYLNEPAKTYAIDYQVQVRSKQDFSANVSAENGMAIQGIALVFFSGFALGMAAYHFATRKQ